MPFTQQQLTVLTEAIASGATTVKYGDKEVTYRSLTEMRSLLQQMQAEVTPEITNTNSSRRYAEFSKGT